MAKKEGWLAPKPWAGLAVGLGAFALAGLVLAPAAGRDDAAITAWAAQALARYGQILNINGKTLEQSSSLGQVLLQAAFMRLSGLPALLAGRAFSLLGGLLGLATLWVLARRSQPGWRWVGAASLALLGGNIYYMYWSFGGLETTFAALAWLAFLAAWADMVIPGQTGAWGPGAKRRLLVAAACAVLAFLLRPEAPLLGIAFAGAMLLLELARPKRDHREQSGLGWHAAFLLVCVGYFGALLAWRLWMFGMPFPQPVAAKVGGQSLAGLRVGALYLWASLANAQTGPLVALFSLGTAWQAWRWLRRRPAQALETGAVVLALAGFGFVLTSAGDWMEGGRFVVPYLPLLALVALKPARALWRKNWGRVGLAVLLAIQVWGAARFLAEDSMAIPAWRGPLPVSLNPLDLEDWLVSHNAAMARDRSFVPLLEREIERLLAARGAPVAVMSGQMGYVPLAINQRHYGQVVWVDRNSLVDDLFTRCPLTAAWERDEGGRLHVFYKPFAKNLLELQAQCGITQPDLVYELDYFRGQAENQGFGVLAEQTGEIPHVGIAWPVGRTFPAGEFVAGAQGR